MAATAKFIPMAPLNSSRAPRRTRQARRHSRRRPRAASRSAGRFFRSRRGFRHAPRGEPDSRAEEQFHETFGNPVALALLLASVCAAPFAFARRHLRRTRRLRKTTRSSSPRDAARKTCKTCRLSISVQTAEALAQRGAENITVLQETTPNATIQIARGSNSTLIGFIRGVGQQDPLWGFEPGVGLYVDDVYIARPQGAVLDIFDIERIEVLRGPQGTLYGRNTIGGAVKYVTRRLDLSEPRSLRARYNVRLLQPNRPDPLRLGAALRHVRRWRRVGAALYRDGYGANLTTGAEHYNKDVAAYRRQRRMDAYVGFPGALLRRSPRRRLRCRATATAKPATAFSPPTRCCRASTTRAPASATTTTLKPPAIRSRRRTTSTTCSR